MLPWLRRTLVTGFFVTVPLAVSLIALVWTFRLIDGLTHGLSVRLFGTHVPGLGIAAGIVLMVLVGALARNIFGRRLLAKGEELLMHVPFFSTVYSPVKQLLAAFSPDNEYGFKHVVLVQDPVRGTVLGFLTKEFGLRAEGAEGGAVGGAGEGGKMAAVYVPTNHLYLGDVLICRRDQLTFPDLTVEQGIRIFLTGGMALPPNVESKRQSVRSGHDRD
jgi:uncharacterized membrane protein